MGVLEEKLTKDNPNMTVDVDDLENYYEDITTTIHDIITEVVVHSHPKKRKNGRVVSTRTQGLYAARIRDFGSGRKITVNNNKTWNKLLSSTRFDDYTDYYRCLDVLTR